LAYVHQRLTERVRRHKLTPLEQKRVMARVTGTINYTGFADADVVIEAVFEDLDLKQKMVKEVEAAGKSDLIFASNTSAIPIRKIAEASSHPETVIGMHYFSPVEKMPLVEITVTEQTAPWVTATCVALGKQQGKTVIVVHDGPGFYTSRILAPYLIEALRLVSEGVPIEAIDNAIKDFGFPVGPIALLDEVGLDVAEKVMKTIFETFGERLDSPPNIDKLIADKRFGHKNKRGFYRYDGKKGAKQVDESVYQVLGVAPTASLSATEITERCALLMINEAALCFGEGILRSARDGDVGAVMGLGFPPFRGGPFRYVDAVGAKDIVGRLEHYAQKHGKRFTPAPILVELAGRGGRFYGEDAPKPGSQ
jgi:3-hydroxyacyl-CoA dehydrogenase/enoyl-CoA hydratase/3-hydroxybutyryl-CoA epimerase